ncbi:hypothetical protein JW935_22410 [candidate division KSB1 bacterium]|nr:hypothetical protein [candidate division KSB1 bacterium]
MKLATLAHSKILNGTSEAEGLLRFARKAFPEPEWQVFYLNEYRIIPFDFYENVVKSSDLLLITEYGGYIGRGQCDLLKAALAAGVQVQAIRSRHQGFVLSEVNGFKLMRNFDQKNEYASIDKK